MQPRTHIDCAPFAWEEPEWHFQLYGGRGAVIRLGQCLVAIDGSVRIKVLQGDCGNIVQLQQCSRKQYSYDPNSSKIHCSRWASTSRLQRWFYVLDLQPIYNEINLRFHISLIPGPQTYPEAYRFIRIRGMYLWPEYMEYIRVQPRACGGDT